MVMSNINDINQDEANLGILILKPQMGKRSFFASLDRVDADDDDDDDDGGDDGDDGDYADDEKLWALY